MADGPRSANWRDAALEVTVTRLRRCRHRLPCGEPVLRRPTRRSRHAPYAGRYFFGISAPATKFNVAKPALAPLQGFSAGVRLLSGGDAPGYPMTPLQASKSRHARPRRA